ncbi:DUF4198 domain-containing protein [Ferrimonas lipolytica]|uniref:DUF4198 domain-containing protein n=2 Tax=Ferrimonas lipolytica TaxID=2724191 RepID=A0A6H1UM37_9GAMM|nr:DUF4198 domain-containing protein [Ferrimonas lipolytica]
MTKIKGLALAVGLGFSALATAHPTWLLPSHFSVSKAEGSWITFDYTASHTVFSVDKPASAHDAKIIMPSGATERPDFVLKGQRRSVFDFFFIEEGTHKVVVANQDPLYLTFYTDRRGDKGKIQANKITREDKLPRGATDAKTMAIIKHTESYVTVMAPTEIKATNKGFEMVPVTHPADLIENEAFTFSYLVNGKPVEGVEVTLTQEGAQYRDAQDALIAKTDTNGEVEFTVASAGRYLLAANQRYKLKGDSMADMATTMLHTTIEVQLD